MLSPFLAHKELLCDSVRLCGVLSVERCCYSRCSNASAEQPSQLSMTGCLRPLDTVKLTRVLKLIAKSAEQVKAPSEREPASQTTEGACGQYNPSQRIDSFEHDGPSDMPRSARRGILPHDAKKIPRGK